MAHLAQTVMISSGSAGAICSATVHSTHERTRTRPLDPNVWFVRKGSTMTRTPQITRCYTSLSMLVVLSTLLGVFASLARPAATFAADAPWYNSSWLYRKQITIDGSQVSGAAELINFPLLISGVDLDWRSSGDGGQVGKSDGTDILFTSSDGTTKLDHEIEKYVGATGELIAWVRIPVLAPATNTDIYIY